MELDGIIKQNNENPEGRIVPRYFEYEEQPVNMVEMLRYSGIPIDAAKKMLAEGSPLLDHAEKAIALCKNRLVFKVGYFSAPLRRDEEDFPILPIDAKSENLKKNLKNCEAYVMFAATVGAGMDRLIRRYEVSDSSMGVFLQGLGAERAETLCNHFCKEVEDEAAKYGYKTHPRFSPGFGDLPITVQKDFLDALDAGRRLGITLNESYLMNPSKSVTAIIGLEKTENE